MGNKAEKRVLKKMALVDVKLFVLRGFLIFNIYYGADAAAPTGCALYETVSLIGRFDCEFNAITFPLTMTDFSSPDPQRLRIYNVSGTLPSPSFSGFNSFNTGTIDTDYPAALEIECVNGGTLVISAGTFSGMDYLQEFLITNCVITDLPDNVFSDFGTLNYFKIEGGSIGTTQTNSLNGLAVTRSNSPSPLGAFVIQNSPIGTGTLAAGFLDPLTTVSTIVLGNTELYLIDVNTFTQNTIVRNLSMSGNNFQIIPENIFSGLDTLMFLDLRNIPLNCSCAGVWFLDKLAEAEVDIVGAAICNQPSSYVSQRATKFHDENCPYNPCGNIPGINADPLCYTIFQLFGYVVICGCLITALVAIYVYLNTRVHIALPKYRLEQKKKKAWRKVKDSLYKGVVNLVPPASTGIKGSRYPQYTKAMKRVRSSNEVAHLDLPSYSDLEKEDLTNASSKSEKEDFAIAVIEQSGQDDHGSTQNTDDRKNYSATSRSELKVTFNENDENDTITIDKATEA